MNTGQLLLSDQTWLLVSRGFELSLINMAFKSSLIIGLTLLITLLMRRNSAATVHRLWTIGFCGCLFIPFTVFVTPFWSLAVLPEISSGNLFTTSHVNTNFQTLEVTAMNTELPRLVVNGSQIDAQQFTRGFESPEPKSDTLDLNQYSGFSSVSNDQKTEASPIVPPVHSSSPSTFFLLWSTGTLLCLIRFLRHHVIMWQMLSRCQNLESPDWMHPLSASRRALGCLRNVKLKSSPEMQSPILTGIFRPVIVLPEQSESWSFERRQLVLMHELAHLSRFDLMTQFVACLVCCLNWFNPVTWWGLREMRRLRETACDDLVVTHGTSPADYAEVLLEIAKTYRHRELINAVGMTRHSNVESRIYDILNQSQNRLVLSAKTWRRLLFVGATMIVAVGFTRFHGPTATAESETPQTQLDSSQATQGAENDNAQQSDSTLRTITVHIHREDGTPIKGARVFASIWSVEGEPNFPNNTSHSDASGVAKIQAPKHFEILRIWAESPGFVPQFLNFDSRKYPIAEKGILIPDIMTISMPKGEELSGKVVDEDGLPIPGIEVKVQISINAPSSPFGGLFDRVNGHATSRLLTATDGTWRILNAPSLPNDQDVNVNFYLNDPNRKYVEVDKINSRDNDATSASALRNGTSVLTMKRVIPIRGQVEDESGNPIPTGLIVWSNNPGSFSGVTTGEIDSDGHFECHSLSAGDYFFTVMAPGYQPNRFPVKVFNGMSEPRFVLKHGQRITIKIEDSNGLPISNPYVTINNWRGVSSLYNHTSPYLIDSKIPIRGDEDGVYTWDWAPEDVVNYSISMTGYATQYQSLTPREAPYVIKLKPELIAKGHVTERGTGHSIERFSITLLSGEGAENLSQNDPLNTVQFAGGVYVLPIQQQESPRYYSLKIEAPGYRTIVSEKSFLPSDGIIVVDFELEPAPARSGQIIGPGGQPVSKANVLIATRTTSQFNNGYENLDVVDAITDNEGDFQLNATSETIRLRVFHQLGYAEVFRLPNDPLGTITLQPWASISGRVLQAGKPVVGQTVRYEMPSSQSTNGIPTNDFYVSRTNSEGKFHFHQLPTAEGFLGFPLNGWMDLDVMSSQNLAVKTKSGQHQTVELGATGAILTGRVIESGFAGGKLNKKWSRNYLIPRATASETPQQAAMKLLLEQPNWSSDRTLDQLASEIPSYTFTMTPDGELQISGVPAGTYDMVLRLDHKNMADKYELAGSQIITINVTAEDVKSGTKDLGTIEVNCLQVP